MAQAACAAPLVEEARGPLLGPVTLATPWAPARLQARVERVEGVVDSRQRASSGLGRPDVAVARAVMGRVVDWPLSVAQAVHMAQDRAALDHMESFAPTGQRAAWRSGPREW